MRKIKWLKSAACGKMNCGQVRKTENGFAIRSSKRPKKTAIMDAEEYEEFLAGVKRGDFDLDKF